MPHPCSLKVQVPPQLSALRWTHFRTGLPAPPHPLRKAPPYLAARFCEPNPLPVVTSFLRLPSDRNTPIRTLQSWTSSRPLRAVPEPAQLHAPSPPCRLSERQSRIAERRNPGFQVCARTPDVACLPLHPGVQGPCSRSRD